MTSDVRIFNDVKGLAQLRADAARQSPEAASEAARQFEALFVQMMLKSMRDANAALGEGKDTTYQDMFDQQIAMEMTQGKGLGLADMLVRQLQLAVGGEPEAATGDGALKLNLNAPGLAGLLNRDPASAGLRAATLLSSLKPGVSSPDLESLSAPALPSDLVGDAAGLSSGSRQDFRPGSPQAFIRDIWPHARAAGEALNVDPRAIVAQAALETGWGSRLIRDEAGRSGNNLFGIKADSRWTGDRVTVQTLEYEGGIPKPQRAQFRAYDNLAEGFADYVDFLKANPRYTEALRSGPNAGRYAEGLQAAGYATDPRYAEKIRDILASPTLQAVLGAPNERLKAGAEVPTYL